MLQVDDFELFRNRAYSFGGTAFPGALEIQNNPTFLKLQEKTPSPSSENYTLQESEKIGKTNNSPTSIRSPSNIKLEQRRKTMPEAKHRKDSSTGGNSENQLKPDTPKQVRCSLYLTIPYLNIPYLNNLITC